MLVAITAFSILNRIRTVFRRNPHSDPIRIERILSFVLQTKQYSIWKQINWNDKSDEIMARNRTHDTQWTYTAVAFALQLIYASGNVCKCVNLRTLVEFLLNFFSIFSGSMSKELLSFVNLTVYSIAFIYQMVYENMLLSFVDQLRVYVYYVIKSESKSVCHNFCRQNEKWFVICTECTVHSVHSICSVSGFVKLVPEAWIPVIIVFYFIHLK